MNPLPQYGTFTFLPYSDGCLESTPTPPAPDGTSTSKKEPLHIQSASTWSYCGPLLAPSSDKFPPSFHAWSELAFSAPSTLLSRLLPLLSFLQTFLSSAGAHHYWLTIRATQPTHDFDTPRWHTDDDFFSQNDLAPSQLSHWKLAATLLGPRTLFLADSAHGREVQSAAKQTEREKRADHMCSSVRCIWCADAGDAVRERLARAFDGEQVVVPAQGEVALFRIGDKAGALHSEPRCHTDRIFVNVTPATEAGLRTLMKRWEMGYPRAWCFGLPVGFVVADEMGGERAEGGRGGEREEMEGGVKEEGKARRGPRGGRSWLDRTGLRFVRLPETGV